VNEPIRDDLILLYWSNNLFLDVRPVNSDSKSDYPGLFSSVLEQMHPAIACICMSDVSDPYILGRGSLLCLLACFWKVGAAGVVACSWVGGVDSDFASVACTLDCDLRLSPFFPFFFDDDSGHGFLTDSFSSAISSLMVNCRFNNFPKFSRPSLS
jgi:hypothetical protein